MVGHVIAVHDNSLFADALQELSHRELAPQRVSLEVHVRGHEEPLMPLYRRYHLFHHEPPFFSFILSRISKISFVRSNESSILKSSSGTKRSFILSETRFFM